MRLSTDLFGTFRFSRVEQEKNETSIHLVRSFFQVVVTEFMNNADFQVFAINLKDFPFQIQKASEQQQEQKKQPNSKVQKTIKRI